MQIIVLAIVFSLAVGCSKGVIPDKLPPVVIKTDTGSGDREAIDPKYKELADLTVSLTKEVNELKNSPASPEQAVKIKELETELAAAKAAGDARIVEIMEKLTVLEKQLTAAKAASVQDKAEIIGILTEQKKLAETLLVSEKSKQNNEQSPEKVMALRSRKTEIFKEIEVISGDEDTETVDTVPTAEAPSAEPNVPEADEAEDKVSLSLDKNAKLQIEGSGEFVNVEGDVKLHVEGFALVTPSEKFSSTGTKTAVNSTDTAAGGEKFGYITFKNKEDAKYIGYCVKINMLEIFKLTPDDKESMLSIEEKDKDLLHGNFDSDSSTCKVIETNP